MPLRAFVSSTYDDLKPHRAEVITTLRRAGFFVDSMEEWTSDGRQPKEFSRWHVEQCDVMVLLVGHRLGFIPSGETLSVTQLEYECARSLGIEILTFLKEDRADWKVDPDVDVDIRAWRSELCENHGVSYFDDIPQSIDLGPALARWLQRDNERRIPRQIPPSPDDFCGRSEEVEQAVDVLSSGAMRAVNISGLGGSGKSVLAIEILNRLVGKFRGGQIYLDLRGTSENPVPVTTAMQHVIRSLQPDVGDLDDSFALAGHYSSLLAEREVIMLLDNAASRAQVVQLLPPPGSAAIVTSRHHFVLPGSLRIALSGFPQQDAEKFLTRICPPTAGVETEIVQLCDGLPLALRIAADTILIRPDLAPEDFVRRLKDEQQRLAQLEVDGDESGIRASLGLSYELLTPVQQSSLRALSICSGKFDRSALLAILDLDEDSALEVVGALLRSSLIEWQDGAGGSGYRLHDLVRLFLKEKMEVSEQEPLVARHVHHFAGVLLSAAEAHRSREDGMAAFDAARRNLEQMVNALSRLPESAVSEAKAIAKALCETTDILHNRLSRAERIAWLRCGIQAAEAAEDPFSQCRLMSAAGNCLGNEGKREQALEFLNGSIELAREQRLHQELCHALNLAGQVYWRCGEPQQALKHFTESVAISEKTQNINELCDLFVNISLVQQELRQFALSVEAAQHALNLAQRVGNRIVEAQASAILAARLIGEDTVDQALGLASSSLEIAKELGDRHQEGVALSLIGVAHRKLNELEESIAHLEAAREIMIELEDWFFAADASRQLGLTLERADDFVKAVVELNLSREYRDRIGLPPNVEDALRVADLEQKISEQAEPDYD